MRNEKSMHCISDNFSPIIPIDENNIETLLKKTV